MKEQKLPVSKLRYADIKGFEFSNLMAKLGNTPTSAPKAAKLRAIVKSYNGEIDRISKAFDEEIRKKFAKVDEKGTIIDAQDGYGFVPAEGKETELAAAVKEFGDREATLSCAPLTPDTLTDIKTTAKELELLGDLFSEENGPGVPHLQMQR